MKKSEAGKHKNRRKRKMNTIYRVTYDGEIVAEVASNRSMSIEDVLNQKGISIDDYDDYD